MSGTTRTAVARITEGHFRSAMILVVWIARMTFGGLECYARVSRTENSERGTLGRWRSCSFSFRL
jgi:hypothetical protein